MASEANGERERASKAIAEALSSGDAGASGSSAPEAAVAALPNPKELFCDNWDMVKTVLGILRQFAPAFLRPLIDLVIKGGDALRGVICQ